MWGDLVCRSYTAYVLCIYRYLIIPNYPHIASKWREFARVHICVSNQNWHQYYLSGPFSYTIYEIMAYVGFLLILSDTVKFCESEIFLRVRQWFLSVFQNFFVLYKKPKCWCCPLPKQQTQEKCYLSGATSMQFIQRRIQLRKS